VIHLAVRRSRVFIECGVPHSQGSSDDFNGVSAASQQASVFFSVSSYESAEQALTCLSFGFGAEPPQHDFEDIYFTPNDLIY
jgi:hypothetical protein